MTIEHLPVLILNPHSRCNCRCKMCDIWKTTAVQEISARDLEEQMETIGRLRVQWVVLSGGEPLMHSNLWELCALLRRNYKIRITLLSSGLLLGRYAASIVEYVDDVIVSLDGPPVVHDSIRGIPHAFDLLAAGMRTLRTLRPDFGISARCTVQSANFRFLNAVTDTAQDLGLDSISFLAADLSSSAFQRPGGWPEERQAQVGVNADELAALDVELDALIARNECGGFVRESPAKLRRISHHFRAHLGKTAPAAPACNAPWTSAVVEADGTVRPCFFHRAIGHLTPGSTLDQILNGPEAVSFRASLDVASNPICQRCVCSLNWRDFA